MKTKIISGFPAVGKSHFYENNSELIVLDSDSSKFSWISEGVRHPEFPQNYIEHIKSNIGKANVILVSSHKVVRDALKENNIHYTLMYPDKSLKDEYIQRYKHRGNNDAFIKMIDSNWDSFIDEIEQETYPEKIKLKHSQYLNDAIPRPVVCNGICRSQLDDYCGMHMSNEECPACEAIWSQAYRENQLRKAKKWFEDVTEADSNLISLMGLTEERLIKMYEREFR